MALETAVSDAFTDTNGTALASHTPGTDEEGNGWREIRSGVCEIQANKAAQRTGGFQTCANGGAADHTVRCTMTISNTNSTEVTGLVVRNDGVVTANHNSWLALWNGGKWSLGDVVNGSFTERASNLVPSAAPGDTIDFELRCFGNIITMIDHTNGDTLFFESTTHNDHEWAGITGNEAPTVTTPMAFDDLTIQRCTQAASGGVPKSRIIGGV